jgi:hypothetical protein
LIPWFRISGAGDVPVSEREGVFPTTDKPPPKKKAKTKAQGGVTGQDGGMGAGDGVPAKGKSKSKVSSANGRNSGAGPQPNQGSGNSQGPMSGAAAAAAPPRLGYGPKMTVGQGKQLSAKGLGREGAGASGASIPRSGQQQQPQHPHQQPGANYKSGQNAPHHMGASAAQAAVPAPIRVRQAFKWTYNLRKKAIDKSRVRRSACPWPSDLLSGIILTSNRWRQAAVHSAASQRLGRAHCDGCS